LASYYGSLQCNGERQASRLGVDGPRNGKLVERFCSDGPHVAEKLEQDLALKDRGNGEEQVRLRSIDLKSM
jgi:hypothetical protein